jgi:hypothetical protein
LGNSEVAFFFIHPVHKLITKTILRIDIIKEISCKTFNV